MAKGLRYAVDNCLAYVRDLSTGADRWESRPAWLEFSPNNICNLRCIMCGQADGLPLEVMPREKAIEVLDQVLPDVSLITPSALSEPMLANMSLMVEKCREHGVFMNFHTNATVLNGSRLRKIGDRVHKLFISIDSSDKKTFETLRAGADFDRVVANIKSILPVAIEMTIPVGFVAVYMRQNASHMADLIDFLADLGAAESKSELRVQPMLLNAEGIRNADPHDHYSDAQICAFLNHACNRARERRVSFHVEMDDPFRRHVTPQSPVHRGILPELIDVVAANIRERHPGFCSMAAYYLKILPNGSVFPCCRGPKELEMGNVNEQTVEEIWNGEKYRAFRRRMLAGDYPKVCSTCDILCANPAFKKLEAERKAASMVSPQHPKPVAPVVSPS